MTWTSLESHPYREVLEFEQATRGAPWLVAVAVPPAGSGDPVRVVAWREQDTRAATSPP